MLVERHAFLPRHFWKYTPTTGPERFPGPQQAASSAPGPPPLCSLFVACPVPALLPGALGWQMEAHHTAQGARHVSIFCLQSHLFMGKQTSCYLERLKD